MHLFRFEPLPYSDRWQENKQRKYSCKHFSFLLRLKAFTYPVSSSDIVYGFWSVHLFEFCFSSSLIDRWFLFDYLSVSRTFISSYCKSVLLVNCQWANLSVSVIFFCICRGVCLYVFVIVVLCWFVFLSQCQCVYMSLHFCAMYLSIG